MDKEKIFTQDTKTSNKNPKATPKPKKNIGIDIDNEFYDNIIGAGESNSIDISQINSFTQLSQNRETLYQVLDVMSEDATISSMLEIYSEDTTETNDNGQIVWAESSDSKIGNYITFLLKSLNVDKNIYQWAHSLIKYGDLYLRLYRKSDFEDNLFKHNKTQQTSLNEKFSKLNNAQELEEDVKIKAYSQNDSFVDYIEIVPNPAQMFELTKFGKSYAYIKTNTLAQESKKDYLNYTTYNTYKFNSNDVEIYNAVTFVHGALQDDTPRNPEQIQLFFDNDVNNSDNSYTYTVRRGQSILYDAYKIWRQMMLLENALLLNRLTKSSILRVIEVEVADMDKTKVRPHLQKIKTLVEQKSSLSDGEGLSEYTNPGAMENNIYVPTHGGVGAISTQQIGGDVNVKDIADIDYFKNKFYSAMRIPKQYLGDTEDSTGFNGGTSLSIVSSRYAKTIKRIQATLIQTLTDAINILLIDRGLDSYVNKFTLHMQAPVTQEELDKRENMRNKIGVSDDIMRMVDGIEDEVLKMKILKSVLSNSISNQEVINYIQTYIQNLEKQQEEEKQLEREEENINFEDKHFKDLPIEDEIEDKPIRKNNIENNTPKPNIEDNTSKEDTLPTPDSLNVGDMSDMI